MVFTFLRCFVLQEGVGIVGDGILLGWLVPQSVETTTH